MKTLGDSMGKFLSLLIFKIILVLFIIFTATKLIAVILVENISGLSASKEERVDELRWNLTGKSTTDHAQNLNGTLTFGGRKDLVE
jgi:hypothetical protein